MKAKLKPCKVNDFQRCIKNICISYPYNKSTYIAFMEHVLSGPVELTDEENERSIHTTFEFLDNKNKRMWITKEYVRIIKEQP